MPLPVLTLYELDRPLARAQVLDELAATPGRLRALTEGVTPVGLTRAPGPREWSAFRTCCHVRDAAIVYTARFRWIIFDDDPLLPNYNEDNWVEASTDTVDDLPAILDEIEVSRAGLIRVLRRLPEEGWSRTGRHEVIGQLQLEPYVRHQLAHEEAHLRQLADALSA